ncbi:MAG: hypothetical protein IKQ22_04675 [Clostridia bacterium]|nr:hypothetical protein [Clostridia bacterium]
MARFDCNFTSYTLGRDVEIDVLIPSMTILPVMAEKGKDFTHKPEHKFPVMYLLHGYANNRNSWFSYTNVARYAEERRIAVVTVSAENKCYSYVGQDDFFGFIGKELPDFVTSYFPISERREDTYIAGLSMGGFGTLLHGFSAPERFCAMGPLSSAAQIDPNTVNRQLIGKGLEGMPEVPHVTDCFKLAEKIKAEGKEFPKIYMACGCKDGLYDINVHMRDHLKELGADVTWDEMPEYAHEWPFWDEEIRRFLDWIPRTDYYATLEKTGV